MFLIAEETFSSAMCLVLVWFLIKPYKVTREVRHLGLPIGFGFLCVSYAVSAFTHLYPLAAFSSLPLAWFQLLLRPFSILFLAFTYYFSKKSSKNSRLMWDVTLSAIIVALTSMVIFFFVAPQFAIGNYQVLSIYVRIFNIVCLLYITINTLKSHLVAQDSKTILTPFGYLFLLIGQYSLLIWDMGNINNEFPFYGGLVLRWIGLVLFLLIAYRTFYGSQKRSSK
jgi:hypothetical protein